MSEQDTKEVKDEDNTRFLWVFVGLVGLFYLPLIFGALIGRFIITKALRVPVASFALVTVALAGLYTLIFGVPNIIDDTLAQKDAWMVAIAGNGWEGLFLSAPYTFFLGLLVGAAWTLWKKDVEEPRLELWALVSAKKLEKNITTGGKSVAGFTVGVREDDPSMRVTISPSTAGGHLLITGGTGTGKTTAVVSILTDAVSQRRPVVYLDLKGSEDVPVMLAGLAQKHGRPFQHFAITDQTTPYQGPSPDGSAHYNPASYGDATRRKDLIMGGLGTDVAYYSRMVEQYLQTAFQVLLATGDLENQSTLAALADVMTPDALLRKARDVNDVVAKRCSEYVAQYKDRDFKSALASAHTYLRTFTDSSVGHLLSADGDVVNLEDVDRSNGVVVFSLNSSLYPELARSLATLIVQDVTTYSGSRGGETSPFLFVVDEFSAIGEDNLLNLLQRGRSAGINTMLATQTLADLDTGNSSKFREQVLNTIAGFVVFRTNTSADAETYAGLTGDLDNENGTAVQWQEFQSLGMGECVYINKTPNKGEESVTRTRVVRRNTPPAPTYTVSYNTQDTSFIDEVVPMRSNIPADWIDETPISPEFEDLVSESELDWGAVTVPVNGPVSERDGFSSDEAGNAFADLDFAYESEPVVSEELPVNVEEAPEQVEEETEPVQEVSELVEEEVTVTEPETVEPVVEDYVTDAFDDLHEDVDTVIELPQTPTEPPLNSDPARAMKTFPTAPPPRRR